MSLIQCGQGFYSPFKGEKDDALPKYKSHWNFI
jgi:hypothetical protein